MQAPCEGVLRVDGSLFAQGAVAFRGGVSSTPVCVWPRLARLSRRAHLGAGHDHTPELRASNFKIPRKVRFRFHTLYFSRKRDWIHALSVFWSKTSGTLLR